MGSTFIAKIKKFTDSVVVDGKNSIQIKLDWEQPVSGLYETELSISFKNKTYYRHLSSEIGYIGGVTFVIPVDWLNEMPDSSVGTGEIKLTNINLDSGEIKEEKKKFTIYVSEEFKPEISNLSVVIRDTSKSVVDYALYGLTYPEMRAMASPHSTSPLKTWHITGGGIDVSGDFSYSNGHEGYNFWAAGTVIKTWTNTKFTLTVKDERGRPASITSEEIYVQPYNRPLINSISAYRTDKDGIAKGYGGYIKVTVNAAASPIKNSAEVDINTLKCYVDWKEANGSYSNFTEITNKEPYIFKADEDLNFEIKCEVRDKYMQTEAYCNVMGDNKDFNLSDGGGGAAIGMKATHGYFDVAYNSRFQKGISANDEITSRKGIISTGTGSKGDFLSFGEAERLITYTTPGGSTYYADFDECTNLGLYGVYYNVDASGYEYERVMNMPCTKAGTLRVYNSTGNMDENATEKHLMQEYVVYDGSEVYRRCLTKTRDNADVEWPSGWTFGSWYCYSGTKI